MAKLYNLARMTSATTGTGTLTLGTAVSGCLTFAAAGVQNGDVVHYGIADGTATEVGYGTYTTSDTTLTRNVLKSTSTDAALDLSGQEEVYITALAEDFDDISCRVYQNGVTSITNAWVYIPFPVEAFDTNGMHDNSTNNTRITINIAGKYLCGGTVEIPVNTVCGARIVVNRDHVIAAQKQGNSAAIEEANVSTLENFAAGDYIELQGYSGTTQNSSGDLNTNFWAILIKRTN